MIGYRLIRLPRPHHPVRPGPLAPVVSVSRRSFNEILIIRSTLTFNLDVEVFNSFCQSVVTVVLNTFLPVAGWRFWSSTPPYQYRVCQRFCVLLNGFSSDVVTVRPLYLGCLCGVILSVPGLTCISIPGWLASCRVLAAAMGLTSWCVLLD